MSLRMFGNSIRPNIRDIVGEGGHSESLINNKFVGAWNAQGGDDSCVLHCAMIDLGPVLEIAFGMDREMISHDLNRPKFI